MTKELTFVLCEDTTGVDLKMNLRKQESILDFRETD